MKKILIVDDDRDLVDLLKHALTIKEYNVIGIYDGEEINKTIEHFTPDVILLDIHLGKLNGIDICKELKENPDTKDIKVILFSTHQGKIKTLMGCPDQGFLHKPFYMEDLHSMIEAN